MAVYHYAERVTQAGFVFMDTPGYDPVSVTGQVAGGANLICFTTGRGSCFGCKPVPSLKLATNTSLYLRMQDDMDLNCGQIIDGDASLDDMGAQIYRLLIETASRWREPAESGKVSIVLERPDDVGIIRGDRRRLAQVLDHLMENAIGQTPAGGTVTVAARKALGEIQLTVKDTGRGIPFTVQAHIFDRFIGRERGGPGLGLALVKALTELHGGWVALESEPGAGASFTCHLPEEAQAVSQPELGFAH